MIRWLIRWWRVRRLTRVLGGTPQAHKAARKLAKWAGL